MIKKRIFVVFSTLLLFLGEIYASIMATPRKVQVLSTKYFDILFSEQSKRTAYLIAENGDKYFEQAMDYFGTDQSFRMPVVISPDSEILEVIYSPVPYNRIVLYEGIPSDVNSFFDDEMLSLFYHEVFLAVNESIRAPFTNFMHNFLGSDSFQPVSLINMPFSFTEGLAIVEEGRINDRHFLEILIQAKMENLFPTWYQASAVRDIEPGQELAYAAGAAFTAFIQQKYGFEKYAEFWAECEKLHLYLTPGIFNQIYGEKLATVWKEFEDSIPLPNSRPLMQALEEQATSVFWDDNEARYQNILSTDYGFIWYDDIRHEVDILDVNNPTTTRQVLFLAARVKRLTLSPDGRFISISYEENKKRDNFTKNVTRLYDLKKRTFVSQTYNLRDAAIILLDDDNYAVAGINATKTYPVLEIYRNVDLKKIIVEDLDQDYSEEKENGLVLSKTFDFYTIPYSPVYAGKGKINYITRQNCQNVINQFEIATGTEKQWEIPKINLSNLTFQKTFQLKKTTDFIDSEVYTFEFLPEDEVAFTRMGYIEFNENYEPERIFIQNGDYNGGVNSAVIQNSFVYFSSHKLEHDELIALPFELLTFERVEFKPFENNNKLFDVQAPQINLEKYTIKKYNPIKYYTNGTFYPMLPAGSVDLIEGFHFWPGIGVSYVTEADPLNSTEISLSGSYAFATLDFSTQKKESQDDILEQEKGGLPEHDDYLFIVHVKNTSTPFDILAASSFKFNDDGQYDFRWMAGTSWNMPLGMSVRNLRVNIETENIYSTEFYDQLQVENYPNKDNWVGLDNSYKSFELAASAEYKNYAQYGVSQFEQRGLIVGLKLFSFWDYTKIAEMKAEIDKKNEEAQKAENEKNPENPQKITPQQLNTLDSITQLNVSLYATVAIPRLTPLQMKNGWVLSVPATITAEVMSKNGSALETKGEVLLIGKEIQNGFPFSYVYFNRIGIKAGYGLNLNYDTNVVSLPDLRDVAKFVDVFKNTHIYDNYYLKLNMDFSPPVGRLSSIMVKSEMIFSYYVRTGEKRFSVNFDLVM